MSSTTMRLKLIGLLAAFAVPLIVATGTYIARSHLPLPSPRSYGRLITPARPLAEFTLTDTEGKPFHYSDLRGHWTMIYVGGACDLLCQANLFKMRQTRLALGKDTERMERLYVLTDPSALDAMRALLAEHPGMRVVLADAELARRTLQLKPDDPMGSIYVVDPLANLMMNYPPHAAAKGMLKDLAKLLRISSIG